MCWGSVYYVEDDDDGNMDAVGASIVGVWQNSIEVVWEAGHVRKCVLLGLYLAEKHLQNGINVVS